MRYDLTNKQPLAEVYPELAQYDEFCCGDDKLRFVISLLDEEDKTTDMDRRISKSAKVAGIKKYDDILSDNEVERAMCRYFILLNHDTFELWLSKKIAFGQANHELRIVSQSKDPIGAMKTKLQVSELSEHLRTDILKLERSLFKDPMIERKIKESVGNRVIHYAERYAESDTVE